MGWAGDLLYPDNPERRKEVNALQKNVVDGNTTLVKSVNRYNDLFPSVKSVAALNATLMAMKYNTTLARKDIPKPADAKVETYTDSVISQVTDTVAMLGGGLGAIKLVQKGWATAKIKIKAKIKAKAEGGEAAEGEDIAAEEIGDIAEMGSDIGVSSSISAVEGVEGASALATDTTSEVAALADAVGEGAAAAEIEGLAAEGGEVAGEAAVVGGEVAVSAGSIAFAGGLVVIAVGVELIMGAINGAQERSDLENAEEKLNEALKKINSTQGTITKAQKNLDATFKLAQKRFKLIHADFVKLEKDLAGFNNRRPVVLTEPTYTNAQSIIDAQNFLISNYSTAITLLGDFDNLSLAEKDSEPTMPLDSFKDPDIKNPLVKMLSVEHKVSTDAMRAYMMWYYALKTTDASISTEQSGVLEVSPA